jgi:hypothetical protein
MIFLMNLLTLSFYPLISTNWKIKNSFNLIMMSIFAAISAEKIMLLILDKISNKKVLLLHNYLIILKKNHRQIRAFILNLRKNKPLCIILLQLFFLIYKYFFSLRLYAENYANSNLVNFGDILMI